MPEEPAENAKGESRLKYIGHARTNAFHAARQAEKMDDIIHSTKTMSVCESTF